MRYAHLRRRCRRSSNSAGAPRSGSILSWTACATRHNRSGFLGLTRWHGARWSSRRRRGSHRWRRSPPSTDIDITEGLTGLARLVRARPRPTSCQRRSATGTRPLPRRTQRKPRGGESEDSIWRTAERWRGDRLFRASDGWAGATGRSCALPTADLKRATFAKRWKLGRTANAVPAATSTSQATILAFAPQVTTSLHPR